MFKRKVYDYLKAWKEESDGMSAVMVEGCLEESQMYRPGVVLL